VVISPHGEALSGFPNGSMLFQYEKRMNQIFHQGLHEP
jgi:hypothetical protein